MKPFDLEEYLKKPHLNLVTRDGLPVRIVCTDREANDGYPIVALVKNDESIEWCHQYTIKGRFYFDKDSEYDLFFSSTKKTGYVMVWDGMDGTRCVGADVYDTYDEAKNAAVNDYIAIAKIEWEAQP